MAGLAILGSLLVSILVAKGRCAHQWSLANRRLEAAVAADTLLSDWWRGTEEFPREATGQLSSGMDWKTRKIKSIKANDLDVEVVRLELFDTRAAGTVTAQPLVAVDVVLPKETLSAR